MSKDPAFLFYPGDYLRDTQCLSEGAQVAYDRIMCEHMRNICISKRQLDFFTKRLSGEDIDDLLHVLIGDERGYQIKWVAESIEKRRAYSESRRKNRTSKTEKDMKTYDSHMENENVNEDVGGFPIFKESILADWNSLCEEFPVLPKVRKLSQTRTRHLKKRFEAQEFRDYREIFNKLKKQPFLLGENNRQWTATFDWLIANDTNYLKVLEERYSEVRDKTGTIDPLSLEQKRARQKPL